MNQLSGIPTYIICILVSCILILACFIQKRTKEKITHSFILLQVSFIFYLTTTIVAELAEGHPEYRVLAFIANILTFLAIDIVFACFSIYLCCLVNKNYKPTLPIRIILCLLVIRSILVIVLALTGTLFSINEAGQYVEEKLINVAYAFSACILVSLIAYGIVKRKNITKRELAVVLAYEIVPMVALIIETFTNLYILTGVSLTLSGLLIYVLIQDSEFEKSKVKQSMLEELSNTDLLTNLANRRAFYNTCEHLRPLENVGVMFCDINGLKYVNDHYGHTQGDFLIKKFSELAINAVGEKNIYRISGDEFVIIIQHAQQDDFEKQAKSFVELMHQKYSIAAVGYAYGPCGLIKKLLAEAEEHMYKDKTAFKIPLEKLEERVY